MTTIFQGTSELLTDTLKSVGLGKTQLPDFQRDWLWDDERVRRLLASILQSYPIGAVMLLQTGNPKINFLPRVVEGVSINNDVQIDRLILDGQQRITSLYQALCIGQPVVTKDSRGKPITRWYYLDLKKCIDPYSDKEDAVLSVPEDKIVKGPGNVVLADYSTIEKECEADVLPVSLLFDPANLLTWQNKYFSNPATLEEKSDVWSKFMADVYSAFTQYQLPVIMLTNSTPKEAVCQVFENVNTGGVTLTVFELLTATFAAENFSLRDDWNCRLKGEKCPADFGFTNYFADDPILCNLSNTDFLQSLTLIITYMRKKQNPNAAVSCKRKDILKLELSDYKAWADKITEGFYDAARFLMEQNVFSSRDLPYATQLVPLSAIFVILGNQTHNLSVRQKLAQWYWCGVLGELYGAAVETRFAKDLPQVVSWVNGGAEPDTIAEANFETNRLLTLRTRNSAAYKGIHVLLMREGCRDFLSGVSIDIATYYNDNIDIHHVFPVDYCKKLGIDPNIFNSIVNKTPLSSRTNRIIGGNAPSVYLNKLETDHNISAINLDDCIESHSIDVCALRSDDFETFFNKRQNSLLNHVQKVMGK